MGEGVATARTRPATRRLFMPRQAGSGRMLAQCNCKGNENGFVCDHVAAAKDREINEKGDSACRPKSLRLLTPQVGLEPTTLRLTAECSAIELLRIVMPARMKYPARA